MRAGKLDRIIKIQRSSGTTINAAGTPTETWADLATMRAQLIQASTEEFLRGWGAAAEGVAIFKIRFLDGLKVHDRVIHEGVIHDIREIKELGRRHGLELRTVSIGEVAP